MLIAVNFHYIRECFNAPYPSIFGVTPEQFSLQLDTLGKLANFLSLDDITDIVDGKRPLPEKSVAVTFDDGLKEQYELAWPVLQKKGIPAIFYANTRPVEDNFVTTTHKIHVIRAFTPHEVLVEALQNILKRNDLVFNMPDTKEAQAVYRYDAPEDARIKYFLNYSLDETQQESVVGQIFSELGFDQAEISKDLYMDKSMLTELAKAGCLGTHGHAHRPLGLLCDDAAINDFVTSMTKLKNWTGQNMQTLSYPFGFKEACSKVVADKAEKMGVKFAFTMERAGNKMIDAPMFMARYSTSDTFDAKKIKNIEDFWRSVKHASWFRPE